MEVSNWYSCFPSQSFSISMQWAIFTCIDYHHVQPGYCCICCISSDETRVCTLICHIFAHTRVSFYVVVCMQAGNSCSSDISQFILSLLNKLYRYSQKTKLLTLFTSSNVHVVVCTQCRNGYMLVKWQLTLLWMSSLKTRGLSALTLYLATCQIGPSVRYVPSRHIAEVTNPNLEFLNDLRQVLE